MTNTIKTIAGVLALTSFSLFAQADIAESRPRFYLGLTGGLGGGDTEFEGNITITEDMDTTLSALVLGVELRTGNRFEVSFTSITADFENASADDEFSGIDFDWKFPFGEETVKPFLGLGLGLYTWEDTADLFADDEDLSGIALNLMGGVLVQPHEHLEFEAGYQYKGIGWQTIRPVGSNTDVDTSTSMGNLYISAKYKF
ncbi:porin family protein [Thalassolituus hydrocarboniclasticus]|uniref:Outer membrane beta-barrel protein n=1 Tax=Thalassolituus hydrocarboniclasticus TaxID=2742796 RepID=A0ABY6AHP0_9GAMM|nr:porin family protein [Thalassolituus hydrocarboniclasticus]UXD89214.1 outer membrane beta-barrel protein [Thalassolituus hydrocarboniclasticus]